jgi:cobalamin synthase
MNTGLSDRPPTIGETRERMQRVRVGVTGLAAIILVVALATAIASSVRRSAAETAAESGRPAVVATINATDEKTEPLAQLGVAPNAKDVNAAPEKRPN